MCIVLHTDRGRRTLRLPAPRPLGLVRRLRRAETTVNLALPHPPAPSTRAAAIVSLSRLIWEKLQDGRLPSEPMPRVWGGPGNGEMCSVCDQKAEKPSLVIEGRTEQGHLVLFHPKCFYLWQTGLASTATPGQAPSNGTVPDVAR